MSDACENPTIQNRPLRILVPVNASEDSRWGLRYAVRRQQAGRPVDVVLLHVSEPVVAWQVLRFRTQMEIADWQAARSEAMLADAGRLLDNACIKYRAMHRLGDVVFSILDTAEQLACRRIVMPVEEPFWLRWFSRDIVHRTRKAQRDVPIVMIDSAGFPARASGTRCRPATPATNQPFPEFP